MELVLASNNPHKLAEARRILPGITILTPAELGVKYAYRERGSTFAANALGKARHLQRLVGRPTLADDSGLVVTALGGEPGVPFGALRPTRRAVGRRRPHPLPAGAAGRYAPPRGGLRVLRSAGAGPSPTARGAGGGVRGDQRPAARRRRLRLRPGLSAARLRAHAGGAQLRREGRGFPSRAGAAPLRILLESGAAAQQAGQE